MVYASDTLGYARRLREAGVPDDHAEAHAEAAREFVMDELVTRYDLEMSGAATRRDVEALRHDFEASIAGLRRDLEAAIGALRIHVDTEIAALRNHVATEIAALRSHVATEIAALRHQLERLELRLTVRFGGMLAIGIAILAAIIKL
jgi:hypothetical protein